MSEKLSPTQKKVSNKFKDHEGLLLRLFQHLYRRYSLSGSMSDTKLDYSILSKREGIRHAVHYIGNLAMLKKHEILETEHEKK